MPRIRYDEQLADLNSELIRMGALCEDAISASAKSLATGDVELCRRVDYIYDEIHRMERNIENMCLKLLLHQQPVARDLRQISAALKMITDMDRIGDQAGDIAEIIMLLGGKISKASTPIGKMAEAAIKMVTESIEAFVKQDVLIARAAIEHDDVVDEYFVKVKGALIAMIAQEPACGEYALDLLMIAKYFERIGDHAVNIAEWVLFSVTGEHKHY